MNTYISGQLEKAWMLGGIRRLRPVLAALMVLTAMNTFAQTTVTTLTDANHGKPGYKNGNTFSAAQFRFPAGIALDPSGTTLFMADCSNNAVRMVTAIGNKTSSYTYSVYTNKDGISHPRAIAIDASTNIYVLNQGSGKDGTILKFNGNYLFTYWLKYLIATNASRLTNATSLALDNAANIYVTVQSNTVIRITQSGSKTVVGVITNKSTSLRGIVVMQDGRLALTDAGNNGIWIMDPANTNQQNNAIKLTGFTGADDFVGPPGIAAFNRPENIAKAGNGFLVVADYNNAKVKVVDTYGNVSLLYGVAPKYWTTPYPGWRDGTVDQTLVTVQARQPYGLAVANNGTVYVTETYYSLLRQATGTGLPALPPPPPAAPTIWSVVTNLGQVTLTWSPVSGATSYNIKRSTDTAPQKTYTTIGSSTTNSYSDTTVLDGTTYYYVVSSVKGSTESSDSTSVGVTTALPPVADPQIGFVDYDNVSGYWFFRPVASSVFNNYRHIVIVAADADSQTYFTSGATTTNGIADPTTNDFSAPQGYINGASPVGKSINAYIQFQPDLTIKAMGAKSDGSPNSAVVQARFQFVVGNPAIIGDNAAQFTINDITEDAHLYYTIDGSEPSDTNPNAVDLGTPNTGGTNWTVGFPIFTNTLFKVRAYRDHFQPSAVVSATFSPSNFVANVISFGFANGEASSDFYASPGQTFYAPVTLSLLPAAKIYSLQFNLTVNSGGTNAGPAITPTSSSYDFESMLVKPLPEFPGTFTTIPPYAFETAQLLPPTVNSVEYPPGSGNWFQNLTFTNNALNLLGVGWLERATKTNLYDTVSQDLITYSMAHDTLFKSADSKVIVGGFNFKIPTNAVNGQTYKIQIERPTATSDGVGAAGGDVFIAAPTNGATSGGQPLNALKYVTVNPRKYIAGSVYPFRWFNAGDFGSSNLVNADVVQVFQSAIYALNYPPAGSDFFDGMDACGYTYINNGNGYLEKNTLANPSVLFDGNDTTINQIAFGDDNLDVCDVYVTFRRALDPSLTWFRRFWSNGQRVAEIAPNVANHVASKAAPAAAPIVQAKAASSSVVPPKVNFAAGDIQGSAGQVVQIPITATIFGDYPLRVLMLNLTVEPLDGSPAITTPVQFTQSAPLGTPYTTAAKGNGNYSAVWLNRSITGLSGTVTIGTLTVTIPAGASSDAAYAVHFDHASGSPNGLAAFPKQALTGLITLSSRTNSSFGDGIPDKWRLRWFGSINNYLSLSNACPSGDGINNFKKYVAGVDPNVANNFPSVNAKASVPAGSKMAVHWPTVSGKQYVIERASNLFAGPWTAIGTNNGTGADVEFVDNSAGSVNFYRVRILP